MGYNPALDGLRAVAIAAVVVYHAHESSCPGGWTGVDVFFVLSGFLITKILLQEFAVSGTVDFGRFYVRRALRLSPALGCLLFSVTLASLFSGPRRMYHLEDVLLSGSYLMNWNRAFDWIPGGGGFLGHTWSLAMEEQFYLIWPVTLLVLVKARRLAPAVIFGLLLLVISWRLYLVHSGASPERTYNGFDAHSDPLLLGCMVACADISSTARAVAGRLVAIPVATILVVFASAHIHTRIGQSAGIVTTEVCSAWIVMAALEDGVLRRVLSIRPLAYTGRISYGWYLWHYPFVQLDPHVFPGHVFLGHTYPKALEKAVLVAASYLTAAASYHFVERPFLRLKSRFDPIPGYATLSHEPAERVV